VAVELGLGDALDEAGGERRDEPVGAEELVGVASGCEQLVDDFRSDVHVSQGVAEGPSETAAYTKFLTLPHLPFHDGVREVAILRDEVEVALRGGSNHDLRLSHDEV
jgi:hypothetical protein